MFVIIKGNIARSLKEFKTKNGKTGLTFSIAEYTGLNTPPRWYRCFVFKMEDCQFLYRLKDENKLFGAKLEVKGDLKIKHENAPGRPDCEISRMINVIDIKVLFYPKNNNNNDNNDGYPGYNNNNNQSNTFDEKRYHNTF